MAKANTFDERFGSGNLYRGTHWNQLMVVTFDDRDAHFDQLYRRAASTWEAVSRGKAYYIEQPGIGQQYCCSYKDGSGNFLSGSRHYTLTMPPDPPAETSWSIVVYDVDTRTLILNQEGRPAASSRTGARAAADGSVSLHFAPRCRTVSSATTGSRPTPAKAGSPTCAPTVRPRPTSTRAIRCRTSSWSTRPGRARQDEVMVAEPLRRHATQSQGLPGERLGLLEALLLHVEGARVGDARGRLLGLLLAQDAADLALLVGVLDGRADVFREPQGSSASSQSSSCAAPIAVGGA